MDIQLLIKEAIKGHRPAQKQLYDCYAAAMLGVCFRYTKSLPDAEDVLQEGFIKMFRNLDRYREEGEFGAWLRRIMVNTCINYLKKNAWYNSELVFDDRDLAPVVADTWNDNPEALLSTKQLLSLVRQLPTGYQTIFNLHAIEGYSHVEIGNELGISDATSRTQFFKARKLLRKWINETEIPNAKLNKDAG
ncbi:MAG: sigma-70 family RNA polymerase sigma factor [Sphingobacteriales bacterium]|nr:MAG: sigma-70 family RNA polymerase sigma factor [Sphingobacteriales bacterium]